MGKIRTFIAVEIPQEIRNQIASFQTELKKNGGKVAWVRAENMHLTLKFLGDTEEKLIDEIGEKLKTAVQGKEPFRIRVKGIGAFPNFDRARVFWIGVDEGGEKLAALASQIDKQVSHLGFEKEKRKYSAHLTIGRVKDSRSIDLVKKRILENKDFSAGEFTAKSIFLIKSQLTGAGPIYTILKEIKLG
ncbi:MAG: RNA 2',3'-cyclic phosphodiesterase [Calditrichaeota bacterium]|nr:RNA 2',3'-cyclic phosphodiesterase [Calditrichota bacterium]